MPDLYTAEEYANMHLIYGECRCNTSVAARLYRERYPNVHAPYSEGRLPSRTTVSPVAIDSSIVSNNEVMEMHFEQPVHVSPVPGTSHSEVIPDTIMSIATNTTWYRQQHPFTSITRGSAIAPFAHF
ncbi:hypothetical protein B5X24_HaOG213998 [Helicoverpa armigera]|nr:hypothetical protein B5X24_HaOG213998 [Helicoverpa armigera]